MSYWGMLSILSLTLVQWLGICAFIISIINLVHSLTANRIKVDASLGFYGKTNYLTFYNNSTRKVSITYFEVYTSKFKFLSKRWPVRTPPYDEGIEPDCVIAPYEYKTLSFKDEYSMTGLVFGQRAFVKIWVSGRPKTTIRLSGSLFSHLVNILRRKFSKSKFTDNL